MTLAIGFNSENNYHFSAKVDYDPDVDTPRKLHDLLKKAAGKNMAGDGFTKIVCFDDDSVESDTYELDLDYDLDDELEDELDDDDNSEGLHEDDDNEDDTDEDDDD